MQSKKRLKTLLKTALFATIFASVCLSGCARRTVLVPPGEPVRLRQTIKKAKVWVAAKDGKEVAGQVDLPEGWYAIAPPQAEDPREKVDVDVKPNVTQKN
jgi:hypothetical protein